MYGYKLSLYRGFIVGWPPGKRGGEAVLLALGYTLLIAIGFAVAEVYLKVTSRPSKNGKKLNLNFEMEDASWWVEWVVAATFALVASLIANSHEHKHIGTPQIAFAFVALFVGYSTMPFANRTWCIDEDGKIKGRFHLIALNASAVVILLGTVGVGVKVYG